MQNIENPESEKMRLIETAAKLLKNDIKALDLNRDSYATCEQLSSVYDNVKFLPPTLQLFIEKLFVGKKVDLNIASLG